MDQAAKTDETHENRRSWGPRNASCKRAVAPWEEPANDGHKCLSEMLRELLQKKVNIMTQSLRVALRYRSRSVHLSIETLMGKRTLTGGAPNFSQSP